nr:LysM peptidoglycan-binding domain-containing protein [Oceanipulchritudo coccoides]
MICSILAVMVLAVGMIGCSGTDTVTKETDERAYRRGKSLLREGRNEEALQAFLSVVSTRADAGESHLEAGLIYLNHIKDPLAAIYHFRGYLAASPEGEYADFVKELILTAQKDFAKTLPGNPFGETVERVNLMETVKTLQAENQGLKEQILQFQRDMTEQESEILRYREALNQQQQAGGEGRQVAPIVIAPAQPQDSTADSTPTTYTVQAGDTLSRISSRVYGESGRWMDIFQANRDQLPSPNALKPGQVLRIP